MFRNPIWFGYTRFDTTLSFLIDSSDCDLFRKLCLPWHSVHHSLPAVWKCNNNLTNRGHPYELPNLWLPNSPELNPVDYKIQGNQSARQMCRMSRIRSSISDVWTGEEQSVINNITNQWCRLSPCLHLSHRKTFWIFTMTQISQNVVNCNKRLSQNSLLYKTLPQDSYQFPDIYLSQGSVAKHLRYGGLVNVFYCMFTD